MNWKSNPKVNNDRVLSLEKEIGVPKIIANLLTIRGIKDFETAKYFFRPSLDKLHDPFLMKDMDLAVSRINKAKELEETIMIYGDYDVDGTTSVSLLYSFLSKFFNNVIPYMPDRYKEGYGVSIQGINIAHKKGVSLIVTLDCGINALEQVDYAKERGVDFIICDHHLPSSDIPNAIAVLDPKRNDCSYPFKDLCGCGIGFKLAQALSLKWSIPIKEIIEYLDLVAIAIISDIVPVIDENRILCFHGIRELEKNNRPGLKPLINTLIKPIKTSDIAFKIGPRINAAGRINHSIQAFKLIISKDYNDAEKQYKIINQFNSDRRVIDQATTKEAITQIKELGEENLNTSVVYKKDWHKGVIGIVASRLIETFYRPTVVFTSSGNNFVGSVRSIKDLDIYKVLESCKENIIQFGGHKYAAGLTIEASKYKDFKNSFESAVQKEIRAEQKHLTLNYDLEIDFKDISPKLIRIIFQMSPFGPKNMKPLFRTSGCFESGKSKVVGKNNQHLKLKVKDKTNKIISAIAYDKGEVLDKIKTGNGFDILYTIEENNWDGKKSIQLNIKDFYLNKNPIYN